MRNEYEAHREVYKGLTIKIIQDQDAGNPFEDFDGEPPLAVYSDCGIREYATVYGNVSKAPAFSKYHIRRNLAELASMLGYADGKELMSEARSYGDPVDGVNELIATYIDERYDSERLEILCDLYNMVGVPALLKPSNGCTQGCWAYVLAVATPEFQEATGNGKGYWKDASHLEGPIELWGDWAWGNVYGYVVEDKDGEEIDDGSCWGFYGDYDASYGALSEARSAADSHVEYKRKRRIEQIKTWIRNGVPLQYREA